MQFNALNLIQIYMIFIYMQCNVHNLILIYTIFIYFQFNALLIHCLLFFIILMYIIILISMHVNTCDISYSTIMHWPLYMLIW